MDKTLHPLTVFAVTDVERMVGFYEAAFGWTRRADFPIYVELALPDERGVAFYERNAFATNVGQPPRPVGEGELSGAELYLRCGDLDAAIARLQGLGARELAPKVLKDWGEHVAYFADPEGNVIALAAPG